MKWLGGIPIDRSASHNMVSETVRQYAENDELVVLIPPEGTRSKVKQWKSGFYHIANNANVPICWAMSMPARKKPGLQISIRQAETSTRTWQKSEHSTPIRPA